MLTLIQKKGSFIIFERFYMKNYLEKEILEAFDNLVEIL